MEALFTIIVLALGGTAGFLWYQNKNLKSQARDFKTAQHENLYKEMVKSAEERTKVIRELQKNLEEKRNAYNKAYSDYNDDNSGNGTAGEV